MHLPLLFARKYLRSKKSLSVINITSRVSSVAVGVSVAAMVILLSIYNGFDGKLREIYNHSDPDIIVVPTKGKTFKTDRIDHTELLSVDGVEEASLVLEDKILVEYRNRQMFATLRGVDSLYIDVVPTDDMMWYGDWQLNLGDYQKGVVGQGVDVIFADGYSIKNTAMHDRLTLYVPRRDNISTLLPMGAVRSATLLHAGTLTPDATTLSNYIFCTLGFAQKFLDYPNRASSVAIKITEGADVDKVCNRISEFLGQEFLAKTRYQQNAVVYSVMKYEKWAIFFILLLVTIIASVSIVGSLVMLIIDKRKDIGMLSAMGGDVKLIRNIFVSEGVLISGIGAIGGLLVGLLFCWIQYVFEPIQMPGNTFLMNAYPVVVKVGDIVGIILAVMAVTYIITKFTVSKMLPKNKSLYETRF